MTLDAAQVLCKTRPERLRVMGVAWNGTEEGPNGGRYLGEYWSAAGPAPCPVPAVQPPPGYRARKQIDGQRIRLVQSVARTFTQADIEAIARDAVAMTLSAAARKWCISGSTVQKVMRQLGVRKNRRLTEARS